MDFYRNRKVSSRRGLTPKRDHTVVEFHKTFSIYNQIQEMRLQQLEFGSPYDTGAATALSAPSRPKRR